MNLYGLAKFITGFLLAIALLFLGGTAATRYLMMHLSKLPPRPVFANDSPPKPAASPAPVASPAAAAAPAPETAVSPTPAPVEGYAAIVNESIGLIVREGPSRNSAEIGGVAYNQEVTVLETSPDGEWEKIRLPDSNLEGWVKAGNTDRVNP